MKPVKLSRAVDERNRVVKNLATSLVLYEQIQTTPAKARAARRHTERLITLAKDWKATTDEGKKLALYRTLLSRTADELAAKKLTNVLADLFANRAGGYTRTVALQRRLGDGAEQVSLMLTERTNVAPKATKSTAAANTEPETPKDK